MSSVRTLLVIEDNPGDARLLCEMLAGERTRRVHVGTMIDAETHLARHAVDVVLLDLGLPDSQGLDAIRRIRAAAPEVPLIVLTGTDDDVLAATSLPQGAQDYLVKGQIDSRGLLRAWHYAGERKRLELTEIRGDGSL